MNRPILDHLLNNQPELEETQKVFGEYWYLLRVLGPLEFAAICNYVDNLENSSQVLALVLLGIAYYRHTLDDENPVIYVDQAWKVIEHLTKELNRVPMNGGAE